MTNFLTGLSGISRYSPVLSASRKRDKVIFTHYYGDEYIIKSALSRNLLNKKIEINDIDFSAGMLPVSGLDKIDIVGKNITANNPEAVLTSSELKTRDYQSKIKLDYIGGGAGIGVTNSTFGSYAGLQGGVDFLFGDMLGNHQIFAQAALNGEIFDMGGRVSYINRKNKIAWGIGASHIPLRTGYRELAIEQISLEDGSTINSIVDEINLLRIFDKEVSLFSHLAFNSKLRLEGGVNIGHRGFRWDLHKNYFTEDGFILLGQEREKVEVGDELIFNQFYTLKKGLIGSANIGLVGDNSYFGLTAPLNGHRYRVSLERHFGINDYYGVLGDYRKYIWMKPVSLAFRGLGYVRFDQDVSSVYPTFIGQMGFVRGYDWAFRDNLENIGGDLKSSQLYGSKLAMASFEIRAPFTGPKQLALIGSKVLFTDVALFFDAGIAFDEFDELKSDYSGLKPELAMSVGASLRVNLFGAMIIEPYWAYPLQENGKIVFGLNFIPGW